MQNIKCSRCNKRTSIVFVADKNNTSNVRGYCLACAKEMGIKPVTNLIENMGITDDEIEAVEEQMDSLMAMREDGEMPDLREMLKEQDVDMDGLKDQITAMLNTSSNPDDDKHEEVALVDLDEEKFLNPKKDEDEKDDTFSPGGAPPMPIFKNLFQSLGNNGDGNSHTGSKTKNKKDEKKPKRKHLDTYCNDLTESARQGKLDMIIGREKEISRVIQILCRRTKNNPCLIGEPGVGKTAIAEGLALRIAAGEVPQRLKDKEIHLLDLTALIAGTQFRGQFESRIKGLTDEVKAAGNIILFIDEVHNLVGTGDSEGTMNAANILKPSLSRGEIQVIGATTFNEYRKYIEKDTALERRFQPVTIEEPSINDTIGILTGVKGYYERHHRIMVPDSIVRRAVVFSERYITDRFLPDKAIDLLDEACAAASLRNKHMDEYDRLKDEESNLLEQEQDLEEMVSKEESDYEAMASIRQQLAKISTDIVEVGKQAFSASVTEDDLAHVVELWTGIPASRVQENELKKLGGIEEKLKERIIGQDEAVAAVAAAIRRSRVQINPRRRPASFIFVGPTGTGKTELVKVLSTELFDTPETLIRLDMSEFMEKHSVSRIIGSPPGYVGYDEAGQVTEKVRRRPYSVLLFDEIEKAHPDVLNILLQILDEGKVTDAHGRTVNFENTVLIMTSNAGSNKTETALGFGKTESEANKEKVRKALSDFLRPEFISRIDEIIVFRKLGENDFKNISKLMLNEYVPTLKEKGIEFTFDDKAADYLAKKSIGGKSGARDLRHLIRRQVEDKITAAMIENGDSSIGRIHLTADEKIVLQIL